MDPFEADITAIMARRYIELDELVQTILMRIERMGGEEGED